MEHALALAWKTTSHMIDSIFLSLPNIIVGLVVLVCFLIGARLAKALVIEIAKDARFDQTLGLALGSLTTFAVSILGLLVAAVIMVPSFSPAHLIAGVGLTSLAVGLAFQDLFKNFVAGLFLLWQKPFKIGDEIRTREFAGTVVDIDIRATELKTASGEIVIVPNGVVYTEPIIVYTATAQRRVRLSIKVKNDRQFDNTRKLIYNILKNTEGVSSEPPPAVLLANIEPESMTIDIYFWCSSKHSAMVSISDRVVSSIKTQLDSTVVESRISDPSNKDADKQSQEAA